MNVKRWLKKIILFPAMLMLGIEGEAGSTGTGAAPATATAEAQGSEASTTATENSTGAAPGTGTAEGQGGQEGQTTAQEGAEDATEGSAASLDRAPHQKTLEERAAEIAAKQVSEVEQRLTAKFEAVTQAKAAEKPDFFEIDMTAVNNYFQAKLDEIDALRLEGRPLEALEIQDHLNDIRRQLRENQVKKAEFIQRAQAQQQNEQFVTQMNSRLEDAGNLVAKEHSIPAEVWEKGKEFFRAELAKSPLLQRQYDEKVVTQGPVAAVLFAKEYVEKNMGAKEQAIIDKKEAAKAALPPGKTSTGETTGNADLDALKAKAQATGNAEDLSKYMVAKRAAAATT